MFQKLFFLFVLAFAITFTACQNEEGEPNPKESKEILEKEYAEGDIIEIEVKDPETGEFVLMILLNVGSRLVTGCPTCGWAVGRRLDIWQSTITGLFYTRCANGAIVQVTSFQR